MPQTEAPLPSVEQVERIVELVKSIIFPDYTGKRQSDESIRSFNIGEHMVELQRRLTKQIAHGLQFCENCECILTKEAVYREAERLSLEFIDTLPEIKRLLYTDVQAMFDNDPAAPNYGEVIFCYPIVKTMIHYRIAHRLHQLNVPVIPRIITEQAHSQTGIDIHPGAQIGEYFAIDHGTGVVIGETCIIGRQPRHPLSRRHPGCQVVQVRRERQHAQRSTSPHHRGLRHRLLQRLHPGAHHHWAPQRHWRQYLGHQQCCPLLAHPTIKSCREFLRRWTWHLKESKGTFPVPLLSFNVVMYLC